MAVKFINRRWLTNLFFSVAVGQVLKKGIRPVESWLQLFWKVCWEQFEDGVQLEVTIKTMGVMGVTTVGRWTSDQEVMAYDI